MSDFSESAHAPGLPIITVVGDGQLARMMQTAAIELGCSIRLLAGSPDASAAQVCSDVTIGDYHDLEALGAVAAGCDALTFDHEHVPNEHLRALIDAGVSVQPRPEALIHAQDKLVMRTKVRELGAPVPRFAAVRSVADAEDFVAEVDGAVCLKSCRGGYDGHGVWFPADTDELRELVSDLLERGVELLAEEKIAFERELSALVARTPSGEVRAWPIAESVQRDGICVETIAPAPGLAPEHAAALEELAAKLAEGLGVTGVLAVELFEYAGPQGARFAVNELAMRPHNTGHWTQDGSVTSQFEQHLRAVADIPLGATDLRAPFTVMVNTLGAASEPAESLADRCREVARRFPEAKIHLYGKSYRPGRKLGHVNVCGDDPAEVRRVAQLAAGYLVSATWNDGEA